LLLINYLFICLVHCATELTWTILPSTEDICVPLDLLDYLGLKLNELISLLGNRKWLLTCLYHQYTIV